MQGTGKGQIDVRICQSGVRQSEVWVFLDRFLEEMLGPLEGIRFSELGTEVKTPLEVGVVCRRVDRRGSAKLSLLLRS